MRIQIVSQPLITRAVGLTNGDLRLSANQTCWTEQARMLQALSTALKSRGVQFEMAHQFDPAVQHGFIGSQGEGIKVYQQLVARYGPDVPLIVAEAVWQYSHHILPALNSHRGPILSLGNWSATWPGLVGMANLNASMTKAGIPYSTLWSENFNDPFFNNGLTQWITDGIVTHDTSHVRPLSTLKLPVEDERLGRAVGKAFRQANWIMGIFDEGCMGMFNAIIPDELLNPTGVYKERLSQSALYAYMRDKVTDAEAEQILTELQRRGMKFNWGTNEETELTKNQTLSQIKMYIAAKRIAFEFKCAVIGIQYQQGLKDLVPASDLAEGLLNDLENAPEVRSADRSVVMPDIPHFNEVDECAGLDGLGTEQLWRVLDRKLAEGCSVWQPQNTLHDLRMGWQFDGEGEGCFDPITCRKSVQDYVWEFLISGAVPPTHFAQDYADASSERQPPMYFRLGGGTIKGISKPGFGVWSRVWIDGHKNGTRVDQRLCADVGTFKVVGLPMAETERRWKESTPQWPIMHAVLLGLGEGEVARNRMMARHKSNHIQVVYAPSLEMARKAARIKAAMLAEMGLEVSVCGDVGLN